MGQINTNNYPAVDSLLDADLLIVENATHGTGTTTPKQLRENAIGTDPLQTTAQTVTGAINEIFEMATDTVVGLELGKMTSFSDGVIVTDIDLHRAPVAGDRILFYHNTAVASPSSLTTYNDGVAVTTTIGDFSLTHPAGLTLMKCVVLGESLRWQTVQDITSGYTAGVGISINGTTISNSAPQLGDDIAYSRIDSVTSGALGYFSADADCLVMDFRTDAEPYNGGYTLRLTTTGASFKYAVLKDRAGNNYAEEIPAGSLVMCKSNVSGTGSEADPVVVTVLEIGNTEMAHDVEVLKDICITEKTATGNPLTLTDALPYPALSLSADIVPIQDLHGLPFPYVGGAYKNKLPMTVESIKANNIRGTWSGNTYTVANGTFDILTDADGNVTGIEINGTFTANVSIKLLLPTPKQDSYILTGCPSGGSASTYDLWGGVRNSDDTSWIISFKDNGSGYNFSVSAESAYIQVEAEVKSGYTANHVVFKPMIRLSTETDPTFAPYSNICPISGRTEVAITRTGENISTGVESGTFGTDGVNNANPNRCRTVGYVPLDSNKHYLAQSNVSNLYIAVSYFASNVSGIERISGTGWESLPYSFTPPNGCHYVRCMFSYNSGAQTVINPIDLSDFMLLEDATDFTIQLGQTVYSADINWDTGAMTVTHVIADMGDLTWIQNGTSESGKYRFISVVTGIKPNTQGGVIPDMISSAYKAITPDNSYMLIDGVTITNAYLVVYDSTKDTLSADNFKTAVDGIKVVYPLATPIELTLSPVAVEMLKGYNQISSDGGGDITLTYKADRLAAIEAALAALQNT